MIDISSLVVKRQKTKKQNPTPNPTVTKSPKILIDGLYGINSQAFKNKHAAIMQNSAPQFEYALCVTGQEHC